MSLNPRGWKHWAFLVYFTGRRQEPRCEGVLDFLGVDLRPVSRPGRRPRLAKVWVFRCGVCDTVLFAARGEPVVSLPAASCCVPRPRRPR